MKYYGYKRVSTSTQAEKGQGLDTQDNAIKEYCKANNLVLECIFEDAGISGTETDRQGLNDLLSVLDKNDTVIVLNTSRLWRSDIAGGLIRFNLSKIGADIISVQEPTYSLYTSDPSDYLVNSIMQALASYDRMQINKKLAAGRTAKAAKGSKPAGTAPFGFKWKDKEVVLDYNNNLIALDICQTFHDTGRSLARTKEHCDRMGYRTNTGKEFSKQAIKNLVTNDFYTGIVNHDGKKYQGEHEPIISKDLFDKVNQ